MARRGGNARSHNTARRGLSLPTARSILHRRLPLHPIRQPSLPVFHPPQRDHRLIAPRDRRIVVFSGKSAVVAPAVSKNRFPSSQLRVATPARAFLCARRKIRREVLFAAGVGGTKTRKPKFTQQSSVRC